MSKKSDGNIVIGADIIERVIDLCEKGFDKMEDQKKCENESKKVANEFVKEQLARVQEEMNKTDILDEKYGKLIRVYHDLYDIIRW